MKVTADDLLNGWEMMNSRLMRGYVSLGRWATASLATGYYELLKSETLPVWADELERDFLAKEIQESLEDENRKLGGGNEAMARS